MATEITQDEIIELAIQGHASTRGAIEWAMRQATKQEQDRCCSIVFGMAGSDNVAQRTVDAIRGKK